MKLNRGTLALIAAGVILGAAGLLWSRQDVADGQRGDRKGPQEILVTLEPAVKRQFAETFEGVGTAKANESVILTAKSTETVASLNFADGQKVPAGYVVAELTLREQIADRSQALANLKEAEQTISRLRKLKAKGFATQAQIDQAEAARDSADARLTAMDSRMADRKIRTPFGGVLGLRQVSVGTLVRPGDVITTLDDISSVKIDFTVPETKLSLLKEFMPVTATASAHPGKTFKGKIESFDTRIDPISRSMLVRARIPNSDGLIKPGMLLTVSVELSARETLGVNEQSIVPIEDKQFVFVVSEAKEAERRQVKTGLRVPGFVEILSGISAGENIVVEGTLRLRPGAKVKLAGEGDGNDGAEGQGRKRKRQP